MAILSNVTAIKVRGTYTPGGVGFLKDVSLSTARRGVIGNTASWVETCTCPEGYVGQFCETCKPGYRHDPPNGGPFARCIPCNCHGHANICDKESGRCICEHNTMGENCELCQRGYWGRAVQGTVDDCQECPCPNRGHCQKINDYVTCLECPQGYIGPRCELCLDGFFGDPRGTYGPPKDCEKCVCNDNIDSNAINNCNRTSGECLKCIHNTDGFYCNECLPGYFGDALALQQGDCKHCACVTVGSHTNDAGVALCEQLSGQCRCKQHVIGRQCDRCVDSYYNLQSGNGCESCKCHPVGAVLRTCDMYSGQCTCREGIIGQHCDQCDVERYGFSSEGCKPCDCDPIGSLNLQCARDGQCECRDNVEGRRCDRCKENKWNKAAGCQPCEECYNLVQDGVNLHRGEMERLTQLLDNITSTPTIVNDTEFEGKLREVSNRVDELLQDAQAASAKEGSKSVAEQLTDLRSQLSNVQKVINDAKQTVAQANSTGEDGAVKLAEVEGILHDAVDALKLARDELETEGREALESAIKKSKAFGQQSKRMSAIAQDARELADEHEAEAAEIDGIAKMAFNVSTQAYDIAETAVSEQQNAGRQIYDLNAAVEEAMEFLQATIVAAENANASAALAYNESLTIYTDIKSLTVPRVDADALNQEARNRREEAERIKKEAEALLDENSQLIYKLELKMEEARVMLEGADRQQQIADHLLADLDAADARANESLETANGILKQAQDTLVTLQEFDALVQKSKNKATEALKLIPEIQQMINRAEVKTRDANTALSGAEKDADDARTIAIEAHRLAEDASSDAAGIALSAEETKKKASTLRDEAMQLQEEVEETRDEISTLEVTAEDDHTLAATASNSANTAVAQARLAEDKARVALQTIAEIQSVLNSLSEVDTSQLDELERRLNEAERQLENAQLDQQIDALKQERIKQNKWVKEWEAELEFLTKEVENIREIRDALPHGCFKRVKLEPE